MTGSFGNVLRVFQRLQWKLALTYVLVTVLLTLTLGLSIGVFVDYMHYRSLVHPETVARRTTQRAAQVRSFLAAEPPNTEGLRLWLEDFEADFVSSGGAPDSGVHSVVYYQTLAYYGDPTISAAIVDARGAVLAESVGAIPSGAANGTEMSRVEQEVIASALAGTVRAARPEANGYASTVAAAPITDGARIVGALVVRLRASFEWSKYARSLRSDLLHTFVFVILFVGLVGVCFGFVTARQLTMRLNRITRAADAWGRGDFAATADDDSADELGQLARRLNLMARELKSVLALRQELSTLEERNRLARDLHDSVKQQVFAFAMQVGAARALLDGTTPAVQSRLAEAEKLAHGVQRELVTLIKELQPATPSGERLARALPEMVADWSRQNGVRAEVSYDDSLSLSPAAEQSFFRIAQEALANVARHSSARNVRVRLERRADGGAALTLADDGRGFDENAARLGGVGLHSMRERAEALPSGWFKVESKSGEGTCIEAGCGGARAGEASKILKEDSS